MLFTHKNMLLKIILTALIALETVRVECGSQAECKYTRNSIGIVADCSNLKLTIWPVFNSSVKAIDLSQNKLSNSSPCRKCLPRGLLHLNISHNNISSFRAISLQDLSHLLSLILSYNPFILNESVFPPIMFSNLKYLQSLDLKRNSSDKDLFYRNEYPSAAITMLQSLRHLRIDGLFNKTFDSRFSNLKNLSHLDMSGLSGYCAIRSIEKDFFMYLPNLSHVDLSGCKLKSIKKRALSNLTYLEELNLSFNDELTFQVLKNITPDLCFTSIKTLNLEKLHCVFGMGTQLTIQDLKHLSSTSLEELNIADNRVELFETHAVGYLPKSLKKLLMSKNKFTIGLYLLELHLLENLTYIDVSHNVLQHGDVRYEEYLQFYCDDTRKESHVFEYRDQSERFEKEQSKLHSILTRVIAFPVPPNLETIDVRNSMIGYKLKNWSFTENKIKTIHIQNNAFRRWEGPLGGLNCLRFIDLSNNGCTYMSSAFLPNLSTVKEIFVANNFLGDTLRDDTFYCAKHLTVLDLTNNRISYLPTHIFSSMKELRHLNLSLNAISNFNFRIDHMKNLVSINLSGNQIYSISNYGRRQFDEILRRKKIILNINLLHNPLMCVCETLPSLEWMYERIKDGSVEFVDVEKYTCFDYDNTVYNFTDFEHVVEQMNKRCASYSGIITVSASVIIVFLMMTTGRIVYRYRWRMRYLFYITKSRLRGYKSLAKKEYRFDAFVSYATDDLPFVKNEVIKELEENGGFMLCLHSRDFLPGFEIAENIVSAINKSRKTIVILSPEYIKSYWCMFELNVARMESVYSRDNENILFLIMYKDIGSGDVYIPAILLDIIENKSYIAFPKEKLERDFFWNNVRDTLSLEN